MKAPQAAAIFSALMLLLNGCATPERMITISEDTKLSTGEIVKAFSDVREDYVVQDVPGASGVARWHADGKFRSIWIYQNDFGEIAGKWYVENDRRCISYTEAPPIRPRKLDCLRIYRTGDHYTSVNPDGSIHGTHRLTPLN